MQIERAVLRGEEVYFAVHPDVWEWLHLTVNPATKKQEAVTERALRQAEEHRGVARRAEKERDKQSAALSRVTGARWWTRLKWVFTGLKNIADDQEG